MSRLVILLACLLLAPVSLAASLRQEPVRLDSGQGELYGSLLLPISAKPLPVALIIAGSGPTDRNGNGPEARPDTLRKLAQGLARQGIASLRYDKRGVAASLAATPDERDLSVPRYADDARAWARRLADDPRFSQVILIGHSEGALIASLAARDAPVSGLVSLAGSGRPLDLLLREQLQGKLPPELLASSYWLLDELLAGRTHAQVPAPLMTLFRPSVQPYLISLLQQKPAQAFAQAIPPALIVQGTRDAQVDVSDAQALAVARPDAQLRLFDDMDHQLRRLSPEDAPLSSYQHPERPLAPGLIDAITHFVGSLSATEKSADTSDND